MASSFLRQCICKSAIAHRNSGVNNGFVKISQ